MDHRGRMVTDAQVLDRPALVYFGYTFCPDVCPMDVARNVVAVEILADAGLTVKPVFITIDPARDTVEYLADFVANNHPEMVGLTGTAEQIAKAARAYKVYYRKQPSEDEEYYLMDHSSFSYLMVPGVGFVDFLRSDLPAEVVADRVACVLRAS
jgi:protein SCO1/2